MRQLAGTKTRYRRAHAAPLAGFICGRAKYVFISLLLCGSHNFTTVSDRIGEKVERRVYGTADQH